MRWLSSCLLALLAVGAVEAAGSIRIVRPRHLSTVLGPTTIELQLGVPAGLEVTRVRVTVDGEEIASLTAPPWEVPFDAGDGVHGRRIEATLFLSDGSVSQSTVRTSPLRIQQEVGVNLVNLYPIVRDGSGDYVTDLTRDEFVVLENGVRQEIVRFSTERKPLRVAIVLDTSYSMDKDDKIESARAAALGFLEALEPQDEALVIFFNDEVRVVQDVTRDEESLSRAIASAEALGGTALYDAVYRSAKHLEEFDGRRVMVLLSDGHDEAASGFGPGSLHTLEEALTQTIRSEVMVFTIGLGRRLDREYVRQWSRPTVDEGGERQTLKDILERIAVDSGGRLLLSPRASKLRRAFADITEDLRNQYSLAYVPEDEAAPGEYREIELRVPGRSVEVVARKGYYGKP